MLDTPHLLRELATIAESKRILSRPIDLIAFSADASFYKLVPRAVVLARGIGEIQALFDFSHRHRIPLTFRAAGTSLSGQAITDGILVEVARNWRDVQVEAAGKKVRVQPGVIGGRVNRLLSMYGTKIGPDPASIDACMMGGILANNSSGMCCGVLQNAYHTLESLTFVLPSGTVIDTASPTAEADFRSMEPALTTGLLRLKSEIQSNPVLCETIQRKYKTKNTTGYSLNAFVEFERTVDIFQHLLIGSEGTIAFIAEAVLKTVPDRRIKYTGLLLFHDLHAACAAIISLRDAGAAAVELMDREALRSVQDQEGISPAIKILPPEAAGLLVEFQAAAEDERRRVELAAQRAIQSLRLWNSPFFTHLHREQALLWKIRKGMFPSVGAVRKSGSSVILEDVVFPLERLADATLDLRRLFVKHGYENAIIFGHGKDGNLHFVITQSFHHQPEIARYARLMDDVVRLVVEKYDGALKGEHGTGRNMAPFLETEWGAEAVAIMRRLKALADPENLLNPGVIMNADPKAHLANLKPMPTVEEEVDKCIECGYCEVRCPSRDLTLTPRQRIVVRREMTRAQEEGTAGPEMAASLAADFDYMVLDTCAVDGLCALACPVGIDTGALTKRLRGKSKSLTAQRVARMVAERFVWAESSARFCLRAGHLAQSIVGAERMTRITRWVRALSGPSFPLWTGDLPHPAAGHLQNGVAKDKADAVYFPSCISRILGFLPGEPEGMSLTQVLVALSHRAGLSLFLGNDVAGTCCGVAFSSKGYEQAHRFAVNRSIARFWEWSDHGRLPIVVDTSPCTYGLVTCRPYLEGENQKRFDRLRIVDSVTFAHDELLPRLTVTHKAASIALHPVCSLTKMNLTAKLEAIGRACSEMVFVPPNSGCCGFAGDRGFLFPELTEAATRQQGEEVRSGSFDGYYSSSRTCEIGMTRAVGQKYRSYLHLLEEGSRA
jgi:D-lactate dehydrogenase